MIRPGKASYRNLKRDVAYISAANFSAYALQILIPVLVARSLTTEDFAGYRMVWLVVGTIMGFATLQIPQSLSYFLPHLKRYDRSETIKGAIFILIALGIVSSLLVNPWFPLLPLNLVEVGGPSWFYSAFIFLWVVSSLIEWLPVGDGRAQWQAITIMTLAVVRVTSVSSVAYLTGSLEQILYVLLLFATFRLVLLTVYIHKFHKIKPSLPMDKIIEQINYTWSFGIASGLYSMRRQIELWLVAAFFTATEFASFSLGAVAFPLFGLIRKSINNVVFPSLSKMKAIEDKDGFSKLNKKATSSVAFVLIPTAMFLLFFADDVIEIVFTRRYIEAADVMRICTFGVIPQVLESSALLRVANLGKVALKIDLIMLPLVFLTSIIGIFLAGLSGGAFGSVAALFVGHLWAIKKGAKALNMSFKDLYDVKQLTIIFLMSLFSCSLGYLFTNFAEISSKIFELLLATMLVFLIYLSTMIFSRSFSADFINN